MAIRLECGGCGKSYKLRDEVAGKRIKCKECGNPIAVPMNQDVDADDDFLTALDALTKEGSEAPPYRGLDARDKPEATGGPRKRRAQGTVSHRENGTKYEYTPGGLLMRSVTILMYVYMAGAVISAGSTIFEISMLGEMAAGKDVPMEEIDSSDTRQALIGFLQIGIYLVLSILFLRSLSRANRNARALGASGMEFSPGWCIGWFFVPIMTLYKPYKAVQEMWRASTPKSGRWKNNPVSPIVGSWWALWIISGIAGQAVFRLSLKAETLDEIRMWSFLGLFSEVLDIPLCIVALMMLQQLYAMQEKKWKRVLGSPDSELRGRSCPSCGEALASKDSICPMCGEEITVARGEW